MTAAVDGEACAVVATAADIICSLRGADLAGWTPPWRKHEPAACDGGQEKSGCGGGGGDDVDERDLAWPAVARGKRSRSSRRESPSASASAASADAKKEEKKKKKARRGARGSPASPMDYSGGSGSGSGASTSGGEDGAFCSQPEPPPAFPPAATAAVAAVCQQLAAPAAPAPPPPSKVGGVAGRRTILPVPPPRPAGQRARKKMRLPEIQQMVRSLSVENDALRKEMKALQRACAALSQENGKLETRLDQSTSRNKVISVENKGKKPQAEHQHTAEQEAPNGFVLPDLNLPADV
ncbi:hypothetical protein BDA96_10G270300 [Sorghum bicolor]|uniref:Uncharacterized protein n=1 Tax=Sorghum bicolor TaxID=4558 RepID=A0A921Q704_SORBI|nr:hypothetical protein BDA96_10G270300 [Sorghum bicolor]